jgi:hypothetical protein
MSRRWRRLADSLIDAQPFRLALSRHTQFKIARLVARFLAQTVLPMRRREKHRQLVAHVGQLPPYGLSKESCKIEGRPEIVT